MKRAFKVSEISKYINRILSDDILLSDVQIVGEVSNFTHHTSGHMYFTLKDEDSQIRCVMFKNYNSKIDFPLANGMKIIARGQVSVYERSGSYQLYVRTVKEEGIGDLHLRYEELKKKLDSLGYFDNTHKKDIPKYPREIGIVSSKTGAAIQDILNVMKRRYPLAKLYFYPSLVQGESALDNIISGLNYLDNKNLDLIILARGGGSFEDLFVFNEERLVKTIFNLNTPIITGIGHEIDFTLSDFVSDLRAPTPSAAAELATPNLQRLKDEIKELSYSIKTLVFSKFQLEKEKIDYGERTLSHLSPLRKLENNAQELDLFYNRLKNLDKIEKEVNFLEKAKYKISSLNINSRLDQGFSLILDSKGKKLNSIGELNENDRIKLILRDGNLTANISNLEKESEGFGKLDIWGK